MTQQKDYELADRVRSAIEKEIDSCRDIVDVRVREGVVTLRGNLVAEWERSTVASAAEKVDGVKRIDNDISVDLHKSVEDEALCSEIQETLAEEARVSGDEVRVTVVDRAAVLSGTVPSPSEKDAAEEAARKVGPRGVENEIRVKQD